MKTIFRSAIIVLAVVCVACGIAAAALASETSVGQVSSVEKWTLTVRTDAGQTLALNPRWVKTGNSWNPARPALTILPALEAGERIRVTWSVDNEEGKRNRIDSIEVISAREGVTKGVVVSRSAQQLVIRVPEKPGTVTLNPRWVQINGKWVPDPEMARKLEGLKESSRVTVQWQWDEEGRKRIVGLSAGS